jgi:hypothetical protein
MKIVSLGRMAHFYIPASKWKNSAYVGSRYKDIATLVHEFLIGNYNGYTIRGPFLGMWRPAKGVAPFQEDVIEIKVSFKGKERIPKLHKFLAGMCKVMKEECLYLETGEDSFLIYP